MESLLNTGFSSNLPWAVAFGYLLSIVLKAWMGDRAKVDSLLGEFKDTLVNLNESVKKLSDRIDHINVTHIKDNHNELPANRS